MHQTRYNFSEHSLIELRAIIERRLREDRKEKLRASNIISEESERLITHKSVKRENKILQMTRRVESCDSRIVAWQSDLKELDKLTIECLSGGASSNIVELRVVGE